jgi:hypothetical protein
MRKNHSLASICVFAFLLAAAVPSSRAFAGDTAKDKAAEAAHDTNRAVRKTVRHAKEKGCTWVHGKLDCAARKAKDKAKDLKDKAEDATD